MAGLEKRQNRDELWAILQDWLRACERLEDDDEEVLAFWQMMRSRCDVYVRFLNGGKDGR